MKQPTYFIEVWGSVNRTFNTIPISIDNYRKCIDFTARFGGDIYYTKAVWKIYPKNKEA